jgi:leucyl/phenylalanyl-tRNA--protein transferase
VSNRLDPARPTAELLVRAYVRGIFPMADPDSGRVEWFSPDPRAILPLDAFHVPRSVARLARTARFELRTDGCFERVMRECARPRRGRERTWIDERLVAAYLGLHRIGAAHSVEAWRDGKLVGGLYGVHLGAAFFGESMFCRPEDGGRDASKVCLVRLVEILRAGGFRLLDTQFSTGHLERFGCVQVSRARYLALLSDALAREATWPAPGVLPRPCQAAG